MSDLIEYCGNIFNPNYIVKIEKCTICSVGIADVSECEGFKKLGYTFSFSKEGYYKPYIGRAYLYGVKITLSTGDKIDIAGTTIDKVFEDIKELKNRVRGEV